MDTSGGYQRLSRLEDRDQIYKEIKYNLTSIQHRLQKYADEISFLQTPEEERRCSLAEEKIEDILSLVFRQSPNKKEDQDGYNHLIKEQVQQLREKSWKIGRNEGELTLVKDLQAILDIAQQITTTIDRNTICVTPTKDSSQCSCPCESPLFSTSTVVNSRTKDHSHCRKSVGNNCFSLSSDHRDSQRSVTSSVSTSPRKCSPYLSDSNEVYDKSDLSIEWSSARDTALRERRVPKLIFDFSDSEKDERPGKPTRSSKKINKSISECRSILDESFTSSTCSRSEVTELKSLMSSSEIGSVSSCHDTYLATGPSEEIVSSNPDLGNTMSFRPVRSKYRDNNKIRSPVLYTSGGPPNSRGLITDTQLVTDATVTSEGMISEWDFGESQPVTVSGRSSALGRLREHANSSRDFSISNRPPLGDEEDGGNSFRDFSIPNRPPLVDAEDGANSSRDFSISGRPPMDDAEVGGIDSEMRQPFNQEQRNQVLPNRPRLVPTPSTEFDATDSQICKEMLDSSYFLNRFDRQDASPVADMETAIMQISEHSCSEMSSESSTSSYNAFYSPITGQNMQVRRSSRRHRRKIESDTCRTIIWQRRIPKKAYDLAKMFVWFTSFISLFAIIWIYFPNSFRGSNSSLYSITHLELVYNGWSDFLKTNIELRHFGEAPC